jgi:hypothetical protein
MPAQAPLQQGIFFAKQTPAPKINNAKRGIKKTVSLAE